MSTHQGVPLRDRDLWITQDILNMVIDEACDDRETLKACSLSSSLLLHRSRTHLHRIFTLKHIDCSTPSNLESQKLAELPRLPAIVDYADEFRLVTMKRKYLEDGWEDRKDDFWNALKRFSHARVLRLVRLDWARGPSIGLDDKITLIRAFPAVRDLGIVNSTFADVNEILALLSQFPNLSTLHLREGVSIRKSDDRHAPDDSREAKYPLEATPSFCSSHHRQTSTTSPSVPQRIQIVGCHTDRDVSVSVIRTLIQGSSRRNQVKSLAMTVVLNKEDPSGLPSLIPVIGRYLLDLHIVAQQGDSLATAYPRFETINRGTACLNECSQLRSLRLSLRRSLNARMMELLRDGRSSIWHAFDPILANVLSDAIREITFDCELPDIESAGIMKLQDRLCQAPFLHLERIRFTVANVTVCGAFDDSWRRPTLSLLWKTSLDNLRQRYSLELVFCESVDTDPFLETLYLQDDGIFP